MDSDPATPDIEGKDRLAPSSLSFPVHDDGAFLATLPFKKFLGGRVQVEVRDPAGYRLHSMEYSVDDLPEKLQMKVDPVVPVSLEPSELQTTRRARLTGKILDSAGVRKASHLQVVVRARKADDPASEIRPIGTATTDAYGYFAFDHSDELWQEAEAIVSVGAGVRVPVRLEANRFPRQVILAVPIPAVANGSKTAQSASNGCACDAAPLRSPEPEDLVFAPESFSSDLGGGRCTTFTTPNRTLEEFSTYFIVRTTDPDIGPPRRRHETPQWIKDQILEQLPPFERMYPYSSGRTPTEQVEVRPQQEVVEMGLTSEAGMTTHAGMASYRPVKSASQGSGDAGATGAATPPAPGIMTDAEGHMYVRLDLATLGAIQNDSGAASKRLDLEALDLGLVAGALRSYNKLNVDQLIHLSKKSQMQSDLRAARSASGGRTRVDYNHPIGWDDEPAIYQARSIAHGHILHVKQIWRADGYSLGDLLYSLPLAPGQKKQIAIVDWERSERAARSESLSHSERLDAVLGRDRDINEIVAGSLDESMRGGSSASNWSAAASAGGMFGVFSFGASGGYSGSSSKAWQQSGRDTVVSALQSVRDWTQQSASAVRSQRATVVETVRQGEAARAQTEVVANYNHCHAMTVQYFEVLRHFIVTQEVADVQECLFIPLTITQFTPDKALRWREVLGSHLRDRKLSPAFDALERVENAWEDSDLPVGIMADERVEFIEGELRMVFNIPRPPTHLDQDLENIAADKVKPKSAYISNPAWGWMAVTIDQDPHELYEQLTRDAALMDRVFREKIAPRLAERIVRAMRIYVDAGDTTFRAPLDATLVSNYEPGVPLYVRLNYNGGSLNVSRKNVEDVIIKIDSDSDLFSPEIRKQFPSMAGILTGGLLPPFSTILVKSAHLTYRTRNLSHTLYSSHRVDDRLDVDNPVVLRASRLSSLELRNPRKRDQELSRQLLNHLNDHSEHYHRVIWARMHPDRRFMLLDGFEAPNSGGRSVASVVENRIIGVVGNSLVMPVARGYQLDPTFRPDPKNPATLLQHYTPAQPHPAMRMAVPTQGVFAEAVLGSCNSCEVKDENRFWRWEESPLPDSPAPLSPVSTDSRRAEPGNLTPAGFPAPIINLQNAPSIPDPTGLGAALNALSNPNAFKDITGLTGTQQGALQALQSGLQNATAFGQIAGNLALQSQMTRDIDKTRQVIQEAHDKGWIDDKQAGELLQQAVRAQMGGGGSPPQVPAIPGQDFSAIANTGVEEGRSVTLKNKDGEVVVGPGGDAKDEPAVARSRVHMLSDRHARSFFAGHGQPIYDGRTKLHARIRNKAEGMYLQWGAESNDALFVVQPQREERENIEAIGIKPGLTKIKAELFSGQGYYVHEDETVISVPAFYQIEENQAEFDNALTHHGVLQDKEEVLQIVKTTAEILLSTVNVRLIWSLPPFNETLPAHLQSGGVAAGLHNRVLIKDLDANREWVSVATKLTRFGNALGTWPEAVAQIAANLVDGESTMAGRAIRQATKQVGSTGLPTIEIVTGGEIFLYPGAYKNWKIVNANLETLRDLGAQGTADDKERMHRLYVKALGRLIGNTLAHEILHTILGHHNEEPQMHEMSLPEDLLNRAIDDLLYKTGLELDFDQLPSEAGIKDWFPKSTEPNEMKNPFYAKITQPNQAIIDNLLPVYPAIF